MICLFSSCVDRLSWVAICVEMAMRLAGWLMGVFWWLLSGCVMSSLGGSRFGASDSMRILFMGM